MKKAFLLKLSGNQKFKRLLGSHFKVKGLRAGLVTLKPKQEVGKHNTQNKEEALIILKGKAVVSYGRDKKIKASRHMFVFIPPRVSHNVKNSGSSNLQYIYLTALC